MINPLINENGGVCLVAWRDQGRTNPRSETFLPPAAWLLTWEQNAQPKKTDAGSLCSTASSNEGDGESSGLPLRTGDRQSAPGRGRL